MGMFLKLWALILGMIMAFFSAKTPAKPYEPETVVINGITYKNCFIPEYASLSGSVQIDAKEPFYTEESGLFRSKTDWYKINDRIIIRGKERYPISKTPGTVYYCRESDWNNLKAYYGNIDNWTCYIGTSYLINGERIDDTRIDPQHYSSAFLNGIMQFAYDCSSKNLYEPTRLPQEIDTITSSFHIGMESADKLFLAGTGVIDESKGSFYIEGTYYEGLYTEAFRVPAELQDNIRELTEQYKNAVWHLPDNYRKM